MKKLPRIQLNLLLPSVIFFLLPALSLAQQIDIEIMLKECAAIDHDGQRLSCYDQLLRPAKAADQTGFPVTAENRDGAEPDLPTEPQQPAPQIQPDQAASSVAEAVQDMPVTDDNFGLKEKQARESVARSVRVTGIRKDLTGHFVYTTEDGQVWLQIDKRRVRYDEVPFVAEIRTASLGSFYLKPESYGVSVRVRREK